jgi:hypothetical protein
VKPEDCAIADEIAASLDPLPPANLIALVTTFVRLDKGKAPKSSSDKPRAPIICPAVK